MKCITCEVEINPKWKHAIELNTCPFCGQAIVDEQLRELFSSLRETMEQLSPYQDQLNDWLLSNHSYIKTDSIDLISFVPKDLMTDFVKNNSEKDFQDRKNKKFTVKVATETGEQEVSVEKIQSEERTNEFYKRAEAVKPGIEKFNTVSEKTQKLKALAQQIRREGSAVINQSGMNTTDFSEMSEVVDPEIVAELQSAISGGDAISSALPDPEFGGGDDIPSVILNMANRAARSGKDPNDDLMKLKALQAKAQGNSLSGRGGFSRS